MNANQRGNDVHMVQKTSASNGLASTYAPRTWSAQEKVRTRSHRIFVQKMQMHVCHIYDLVIKLPQQFGATICAGLATLVRQLFLLHIPNHSRTSAPVGGYGYPEAVNGRPWLVTEVAAERVAALPVLHKFLASKLYGDDISEEFAQTLEVDQTSSKLLLPWDVLLGHKTRCGNVIRYARASWLIESQHPIDF
ncbi:uncharacterized protein MYCGRDRAFT_95157 [Zymoseptoria tritici IPO323]|uniref:Uncharacterized protein n=1 Tax=Zymoseptoria tritici (strain CBS 115943 / IPO323) TaxID=336722 RepID=F9XHM5_ZYMTI|nr:uncharacterized protein MYCGRDRAFT_95157 [Zymoseptoria tritici IPO323]EGP85005.1 hypothetical protein MYCGRDRAFT_95157 [Zymoseptoria tritici IPO323]